MSHNSYHYPPTADAYDAVPPTSEYYKPPVYTTPTYGAPTAPSYHHEQHHPPRAASPTSSFSSSSYAGSAGSDSRDQSPDVITYISDRLEVAFDHTPLDRSIAIQAQTSGHLNAQSRDLEAMRLEASRRLQETKQAMTEGMRIAREVKKDLEWSEQKVKELSRKTKEIYPREYQVATMRIGPHNI